MTRVEKFRRMRLMRRRYLLAFILLVFIFTAGITAVDRSTNYFMSGKRGVEFVNIESHPEYIRISFMKKNIYINTKYINRDIAKLKKMLGLAGE